MSQYTPDGEFVWVSENDCHNMGQLWNYADGRIAIFDTLLFNNRNNEEDNKRLIFEMDFKYMPVVHERGDDYPLAPKVMIIEPESTNEMQHNLLAQYLGAACPYSRKLICSFLQKKHYVVRDQLLRFYLDRKMKLVKVNCAIRFKSSPYVASYFAKFVRLSKIICKIQDYLAPWPLRHIRL